MWGMTLKGRGWAKILFSATSRSPLTTAMVPSLSSSMPSCPAPEEAWYVDMMTLFAPNFFMSGSRAMRPMAVVQFGLAMRFLPLHVLPLISGTTRGMSGMYLKAEELSMTMEPLAMSLACSRAKSPETARKHTSVSAAALLSNSSTVTSPHLVFTVDPADLAEPKIRSLSTGKALFSRQPRISFPTAPVAPTTPTVADRGPGRNGEASCSLLRVRAPGVARAPAKLEGYLWMEKASTDAKAKPARARAVNFIV
mmetsp:Transcript_2230/g.4777  ORF Transcript_2230/g.4777 Transcript_2230/m.4777 type:complete len:253 (+) Transcript_2230:522-1280(+)